MDEFKNRFLMSAEAFEHLKTQFDLNAETNACSINGNAPAEIDLRQMRTVTPIRMQGGCGSCWAFSGVAATESAYLAYRNQSLDLAEQELVDCASQHGCHGDTIPRGIEYIQHNGVVQESYYRYVARVSLISKNQIRLTFIKFFLKIYRNNHADDQMHNVSVSQTIAKFTHQMQTKFVKLWLKPTALLPSLLASKI